MIGLPDGSMLPVRRITAEGVISPSGEDPNSLWTWEMLAHYCGFIEAQPGDELAEQYKGYTGARVMSCSGYINSANLATTAVLPPHPDSRDFVQAAVAALDLIPKEDWQILVQAEVQLKHEPWLRVTCTHDESGDSEKGVKGVEGVAAVNAAALRVLEAFYGWSEGIKEDPWARMALEVRWCGDRWRYDASFDYESIT